MARCSIGNRPEEEPEQPCLLTTGWVAELPSKRPRRFTCWLRAVRDDPNVVIASVVLSVR